METIIYIHIPPIHLLRRNKRLADSLQQTASFLFPAGQRPDRSERRRAHSPRVYRYRRLPSSQD